MGVARTRPSGRVEGPHCTRWLAVRMVVGSVALSLAAPAASFATLRAKDSGGSTKGTTTAAKQEAAKPKSVATRPANKSSGVKPVQRKASVRSAAEPAKGKGRGAARTARPVSRNKPKKQAVAVVKGRPKATQVARTKPSRAPAKRRQSVRPVDPWDPSALDQSPIYEAAVELPSFRDMDLLDDDKRYELLNHAVSLLGRPYRFGAAGGRAFDCSGFVRSVFGNVGVDLPHSAREQFGHGDVVRRGDLVPGDLVFFRTYRRGASHVGIYMGEDKFIHAASRFGVRISSLNSDYYAARYLGARRLDM